MLVEVRSREASDGTSERDELLDLLEGLPTASEEDRNALRRARAPRRLSPAELEFWLAAVSRYPGVSAELRARPNTTGEPFTL